MAKRGILTIKPAQNVAAVEDRAQKSKPIRLRKAGQMTKREKRELEAEKEEEQGYINSINTLLIREDHYFWA